MKADLTDELKQRDGVGLEDGELQVRPIDETSDRELRAQFWAGYHTEWFELDVRH